MSTIHVTYALRGDPAKARQRAEALAVEQTVEFPAELVWTPMIRDEVIARVTEVVPVARDLAHCTLAFASRVAEGGLLQLLNMLYGNASILPGTRIVRVELPDDVLAGFRGPRYGKAGLRRLCNAPQRPLLATALKPMGLSARELAELAYRFARGGIDLIKDDHGLADQEWAPFDERVARCADAVARANAETGGKSRYLPHLTGRFDELRERAGYARGQGAGGLLVAPGLVGMETMRALADDDSLALPILSHPALQGTFVAHPDIGVAPEVLFGLLHRLAGADGVVFPNTGGRFSLTPDECRALARAAAAPLGKLAPVLPAPAGGMTVARAGDLVEFYGNDVILLIGGDLHRDGQGEHLEARCRAFREAVEV